MLLNHNYGIETFLKELYHLHTFYSFKCSVIFTTEKIPKILKWHISCSLIIIMVLKHSWKNYTIYTHFIPDKCSVIFTTGSKIPKILKCIYHVAGIIIMLLKQILKVHYTIYTPFIPLECSGYLHKFWQNSKNSKMYISCCLIIIMLLKHSWKNDTIYTPFIPLNVQVILTTDSSVTTSPSKGGISSSSSHGYIFCIIKFIRPLDEFPSLYSGCGIMSHYGIKSRY